MTTAEQLNSVIDKTERIIAICRVLQEENNVLKMENQSLASAVNEGKNRTKELDEKLRVLKLAKSKN